MRYRVPILLLLATAWPVWGQRVGTPTDELTRLSVEDLFQIQVTSVDRKAQQLSRAPAAVFVLTADDIRRSGAASIPEVLQWVPGLTVLRIDGRSWAISARGDAREYADKMLVLIDGRSLYTPLFSGVFWEFLDVPLQDIERIEVVRGPGAVMWGPNAVNGVINIITRSAADTRGIQVGASAGNELRGSLWARWGAAKGDRFAYRVWLKLDDRNPAFSSPGYFPVQGDHVYPQAASIDDLDSRTARVGFRLDVQPTRTSTLMLTGDSYVTGRWESLGFGSTHPDFAGPVRSRTSNEGGSLLTRWTRTLSDSREHSLQFAYEKNQLDLPFNSGARENLAIEFQERRAVSDRHEIYWGLGFQQYRDHTYSDQLQGFQPEASTYRVGDVVLRDEFQLVRRRLTLSAGMRLDYNSYTRWEWQPSVRLLYTPSSRQSAWIAVSRAVRVPSRLDRDLLGGYIQRSPEGLPIAITVRGNPAMRSEIERGAEAGYRFQAGQRWSVDGSVFWSYYTRLRLLAAPSQPNVDLSNGVPSLAMTLNETNAGSGRSYGAEVWGLWQVTPKWRLIPGYSYLHGNQWQPAPTAAGSYEWMFTAVNLAHQGWLRSQFDLTQDWQVDLMVRARSRNQSFHLPGVALLGARLGWRPTRSTELSFTVQNLAGRSVLETVSENPLVAIPLRRSLALQWIQRF